MSERVKWVTRPRKQHNFDGLRERIQRAAPQSSVACVGQMYDNGLELHVSPGAKTNEEVDSIKLAARKAGYDAVWFNNDSGVTIVHAWKRKTNYLYFGFVLLIVVVYFTSDVHKIHSSGFGAAWLGKIRGFTGFHV